MMPGGLRIYSFHSVKGGVGKSALSTLTALRCAADGAETYLIDMDLTGTSLSDVLPLAPPDIEEHPDDEVLDLLSPRKGFCDENETARRIELRADSVSGPGAVGVPYLNDYLLFATPDWEEETDIDPRSVAWQLRGGPERLHVLPSSALPRDLERILPVVLDEEQGGFLEARLEVLLDSLVPEEGETVVVFDTPPTIPGLSRAVLSLAIRLSGDRKLPLSEDQEPPPPRLAAAAITWRAFLVSTTDLQDLRAAGRWMSVLKREEEALKLEERSPIRWLVNFAPSREQAQREVWLQERLSVGRPGSMNSGEILDASLFEAVRWIEQDEALRIFRSTGVPQAPANFLVRLESEA